MAKANRAVTNPATPAATAAAGGDWDETEKTVPPGEATAPASETVAAAPEVATPQPATPPAPEATDEDEAAAQAAPAATEDEYAVKTPDTFKESLVELDRVQKLPERNGQEAKRKQEALLKIQRHVFDIQQGTPAPKINSAAEMKHFAATNDHAEQIQWEQLKRQFPLVRKFDAAHAELVNVNAALRKQVVKN